MFFFILPLILPSFVSFFDLHSSTVHFIHSNHLYFSLHLHTVNETCGSTISRNATSFVNQDNPGTTRTDQTCRTTIDVVGKNICQLKLEFNDFEIKGPDVTGDCSEDVMTVTGTTNDERVPEICGLNTGQHSMYDYNIVNAYPYVNDRVTELILFLYQE